MSTGRPSAEGRSTDWATVLEEMEGEVLAAEESLTAGRTEDIAAWGRRTADWTPPQHLGQLPMDLRERAARLLQHQLSVAEELAERILQSRQQRDLAARMSYARTRPAAAFVDRAM
ncbi:hypothetical protein [Trujillonella endophytica]|uniref:Flagellar protein FliT n=1 Tax=Trujillonella endophytica TaxID=673521 RepID=A0A1H8SGM7_9ACTN|nr:hypothetical protein [Trujillella endophytica]SEO78189.1 hypothetical protein SAMN05660991_01728 [Trujillella endophytica]